MSFQGSTRERTPSAVRWLVAMSILMVCLSGCSLYDDTIGKFIGSEEEELPAADLMAEGMAKYESGYYEEATEAFQKVKDRYPYSRFALEAELRMADSLYQQELYEEAYDAYKEFERLHPKNENIPYAVYQQGMSQFSQISTVDRDQAPTLRAVEEFERLIRKFPEDVYAARARAKLRACYISLAEYELYVGDFYFKNKNYQAAMKRYQYVLKNYPDVGQYYEALDGIRRAKEKLAAQEAAQ